MDGRAPSLQDPPTWLLQSTLTITYIQSPVTKQGGTFWCRDCTLTVRKVKAATGLQLRLLVACTDSLAELPQGACSTWQDVHGCTVLVPCWPCQGQQHMVYLGV